MNIIIIGAFYCPPDYPHPAGVLDFRKVLQEITMAREARSAKRREYRILPFRE